MWSETEKSVLKWIFLILILGSFAFIIWPLLMPLLLGGISALALNPIVNRLILKLKWSDKKSIFLLMTGISLALVLPTLFFLFRSTRSVLELHKAGNLPFQNLQSSQWTLYQSRVFNWLELKVSDLGIDTLTLKNILLESLQKFGQWLVDSLLSWFGQLPALSLFGFIVFLSTIYFLWVRDSIYYGLQRLSFLSESQTEKWNQTLQGICYAILISNLTVGLIQALIVSVGGWLFSAGDFWIVFFVTFICSFIPILGAAPIAVILALLAFAESRYGAGSGLLLTAFIAGVSDNLLRPFLLSGQADIPAALGLIAVIGAVIVFGLPGLFLGPLIASVCYSLYTQAGESNHSSS